MAITVDWPNKIINIPRADLQLIQSAPTEIRQLNLDNFRLELKSLEASDEGMPWEDTHSHNPPVTVGGVTLARVVEIINGYTVTFEDGQYAVNLLGANSNVGDVVNVNQVSVRSANSAGLTYSKEVEDQSFEGAMVWINNEVGLPGTLFPRGTPGSPVDNFEDADLIKEIRGLPNRFHIHGFFTINSGTEFVDHIIYGDSSINTRLILTGTDCTQAAFHTISLSGDVFGSIQADYCRIDGLTGFTGKLQDCGLNGIITLAAGGHHVLIDCHSHVAGTATPILDFDNIPNLQVSIRGFMGGLELRNITDSGTNVSIDLLSGHIKLHETVTSGTVVIRGTGHYTNNGTPLNFVTDGLTYGTSGLTATESTQLAQIDILRKLLQNRMETDPATGLLTIYDDDDTTIFLQGNIYEDVLAAQAYRGRGLERRERLTDPAGTPTPGSGGFSTGFTNGFG